MEQKEQATKSEQSTLERRLIAWVDERTPRRLKNAYTLHKERNARKRIANSIVREMYEPYEQIPLTIEQLDRWERQFDRIFRLRPNDDKEVIMPRVDTKTGVSYYLRFRREQDALIAEEVRSFRRHDEDQENIISQVRIGRNSRMIEAFIINAFEIGEEGNPAIMQQLPVLFPQAALETASLLVGAGMNQP